MAEVPQPLFPEVLAEFTYLRPELDALLAGKQGVLTSEGEVSVTSSAQANLGSTRLGTFVRVSTNPANVGDTLPLGLPTPTLADLGKPLVVYHYAGTGNAASLQLQAKLGNDTATTLIGPALLRGTRSLLQVVSQVRGTPWNDTVAGYTVLATSAEGQLTAAQVKGLLPLGAPAVTYDGSTAVGYATLDAALAAAGSKITLTGAAVSVTATNTTAKTRPSLLYAAGAAIGVNSGVNFRVRGLLDNALLSGDGSLYLVGGGPDAYYAAILASSEANLTVTVPASAYGTIKDSYVKLLTGAGTVYLYGNTVVGTIDTSGGLTVIDRRPGAASAPGGSASIDYANEVEYTAATTLTAASAYKSCLLSGSSSFTLTLPVASTMLGKLIAVRVRTTATAVFTVAAQGSDTINGDAGFVLWAQESIVLLAQASGWTKVSSRLRGMSADLSLEVGANVAIGAQQYDYGYRLPLTRDLNPPTPGMRVAGDGIITILRTARYLVSTRMRADFPGAGNNSLETILFKNQGFAPDYAAQSGYTTGGTVAISTGSGVAQLKAGDQLAVVAYNPGGGSATIWSGNNVPQQIATLSVTEIL